METPFLALEIASCRFCLSVSLKEPFNSLIICSLSIRTERFIFCASSRAFSRITFFLSCNAFLSRITWVRMRRTSSCSFFKARSRSWVFLSSWFNSRSISSIALRPFSSHCLRAKSTTSCGNPKRAAMLRA